MRRCLPRVRRIVFSMVLHHQEADDLTQEIMLKAIRSLGGFKGQASLATWTTRIALNTTYTFLQRRQRRSVEPLLSDPADRSTIRSPVNVIIGKELDYEIQKSLNQLTPKLRAAMVLTAIDGLTPNEAAEIEQCSASAMHSRIHEARKHLRNDLKEYLPSGDKK
ncbi:RNA polymerase sigma factor [Novipirellula aureliae]|uniref:RNA polymerase sigma factor n=1 Tax=Novipirellula aureliae TaxID=2527966 RepID=UPI0021BC76F4|nr:RNA polymerase sigma factor [Novipirellula aureliae]